MKRRIWILPIILSLLIVACGKQAANGPHATVSMKDGSVYKGTVTSTTTTEMTLARDDNSTHTVAVKDVKSIDYDDAPAATSAGTPAASSPQQAPRARPAARRAAEAVHESHEHAEAAQIQTKTYVIPAGTEVAVRAEETIDSEKAAEGQTYAAEVTNDVMDANGDVVIPRGANAQIVLRSASKGGRIRGASDLVIDLATVSVEGKQYQLSTSDMTKQGKDGLGANKRTAVYTGGGAAIGAIIGAIAGHGKGAAIGAGSGAAAGAITQVLTKGKAIRIPVETVLTFKLDQPLRVVASR